MPGTNLKFNTGGATPRMTAMTTPEDVDAQVRDAWEQVGRLGLILGPGCVANLKAPEKNVLQLRKSVELTANL
ncbi:hypothetical protein MYX84_05945 [Acidobacteria bacterium AH-259-O06]|nr:hypothetical protein [Acidobacteria bacterium AH-259-O06]